MAALSVAAALHKACLDSSPLRLDSGVQCRRSCARSSRPLIVSATISKDAPENGTAIGDNKNELRCSVNRRRALVISSLLPLLAAVNNVYLVDTASAAEEDAVRLERVRSALIKAVTKGKAPGVLRLVFHDAGTFNLATNRGGMNGSVVFELDRPENTGLKRSFRVLEKVKTALEPDVQVSWADLIAVAGAEAVAVCGGPKIQVKLGRVDTLTPDPEGQMPEETLTGSQLRKAFQDKGFTTQELVALSGAHSIGNKGFGDPNSFDNTYYNILLQKPWLGKGGEMATSMIGLDSDRALPEDEECLKWVNVYAQYQDLFFQDFTNAYIKLTNTGAQWIS